MSLSEIDESLPHINYYGSIGLEIDEIESAECQWSLKKKQSLKRTLLSVSNASDG